jgi:hypothetical protein
VRLGSVAVSAAIGALVFSCNGGDGEALRLAQESDLSKMTLQAEDVDGLLNRIDAGFLSGREVRYQVDFQPDPSDPPSDPVCVVNGLHLYGDADEAASVLEQLKQSLAEPDDPSTILLTPPALVENSVAFQLADERPFECTSQLESADLYSLAVQRSNVLAFINVWSNKPESVDQAVSLANVEANRIESILGSDQ